MTHSDSPPTDHRLVALGIALLLVAYFATAGLGWPQRGTELTNRLAAPPAHAPAAVDATAEHAPSGQEHHGHEKQPAPEFYTVAPFVLLLLAIAILPLTRLTAHWWESNLHRLYVAAGLAALTLAYYGVVHQHPVDRHFLGHAVVEPAASGPSWELPWTIFQNAIFNEYIPFIVLLFALYTICGGIRIAGDLPAHPLTNTAFLAVGGLLASLIGTTGAAMLLIRPVLETNAERRHVRHTVVFFIFVVCNCGGCLLPIGDPPLFLGYLNGVPFLWTLVLWKEWLLVNALLLAVYYVWDRLYCYPRESRVDLVSDELRVRGLKFTGLWPNAPLLVGVVLSAALLGPTQPFPGTNWTPWLYLREVAQLACVAASLAWSSPESRGANKFSYAAILEVAALFLGIFICMQPALAILDVNGARLNIDTPLKFFWITGSLSSVLDNAPTYLVFFRTAQSLGIEEGPLVAGVPVDMLTAISLGAVFMGAMTYIGNGPNFMVKTIAEGAGVRMPSFFGYVAYSAGVLLPIFLLVSYLFFVP
jgi:Na+/H+ antiporter NhaD/arsenite permease-like protein